SEASASVQRPVCGASVCRIAWIRVRASSNITSNSATASSTKSAPPKPSGFRRGINEWNQSKKNIRLPIARVPRAHRMLEAMEEICIRRATGDDADTLVAHRRAMFYEMGFRDGAALDAMTASFRVWLIERMRGEEYLAWVALAEGQIVAGLGLWLMDWPPHMLGPGARRGNILNVYTESAQRRRGIARRLM